MELTEIERQLGAAIRERAEEKFHKWEKQTFLENTEEQTKEIKERYLEVFINDEIKTLLRSI